jgi:hypothetical protein
MPGLNGPDILVWKQTPSKLTHKAPMEAALQAEMHTRQSPRLHHKRTVLPRPLSPQAMMLTCMVVISGSMLRLPSAICLSHHLARAMLSGECCCCWGCCCCSMGSGLCPPDSRSSLMMVVVTDAGALGASLTASSAFSTAAVAADELPRRMPEGSSLGSAWASIVARTSSAVGSAPEVS